MSALIALPLALLSGLLIGCVGIGGVLLVPALSLGGIAVHDAIAASMFSFLFSGGIATWLYAREGSIEWIPAAWLSVGSVPGALAGAILANAIRGDLLLVLIGLAVAFSGIRSLAGQRQADTADTREMSGATLGFIGLAIGFGSALTGTGGPVLLVPLLIWLRMPVLTAVGLSQAIQVPIATLATIGNAAYGHLDLKLGTLLSIGVVSGAGIGALIAHALPRSILARLVGLILLFIGGLLVVRNRQILFSL
jgi:uncharacterized protein